MMVKVLGLPEFSNRARLRCFRILMTDSPPKKSRQKMAKIRDSAGLNWRNPLYHGLRTSLNTIGPCNPLLFLMEDFSIRLIFNAGRCAVLIFRMEVGRCFALL